MAEKHSQQLKEVGSKLLEGIPPTKDVLIKLLKQAVTSLSEMDQSPPKSVLESMQPFLNAIVKPELLKHQDKEVKLLVATCICEITRVTAPEAPYSDDELKEIFHLIVSTFSGLRDTKSPSFGRRVLILETLARYRSCVVMLDLDCDHLVNEMFSTFFAVASDEHAESVLTSMQTIMVVLLEESEDVHEDLLLIILSPLGRNNKDVAMAARRLAMNVIEQCAAKLEPGVKKFLLSSMSGDSRLLNSQIDYHEVIYDIYRCAPQILSGVVPYLTGELLTDKVDIRLKAVELVGELFAISGSTIPESFHPIFLEFLKRLTDRVVEVRMSVLDHAKLFLLSDPFKPEAPQVISSLCDRLLDFDENIRKQVVAVVCDVACRAISSISSETVKLVAERLRDKSLPVKKYTLERLSDVYRTFCLNRADGSVKTDEFDWIPGKILRCFYDKDFRSDTVEQILCLSLFPAQFSAKDKVMGWIRIFSSFDKVEIKALEKILEQKQRLQQEMQKYLSHRQMHQDNDSPELQKRVMLCFRIMSRCFSDPVKAEDSFQTLDKIKDGNIWKILTSLLDPNTNSLQATGYREDLLRILGEKHPLYGFLDTLSMKSSYILFNKDYVKDFLLEASNQKTAGSRQLTLSCMNILVILANFSPSLLCGIEEDLVHLLEDDDEVIKEGVLQILAKAGGTIREQLGVSSSSLDLLLERMCLEGSRRQAKYAVHALAAVTKDDGLKSLSVLYKRLVDMLEEKTNLPTVLQSLGCIAQIAMPIFETRESEIEEFIKANILGCSPEKEYLLKESWNDKSELCSLKILGIKTLVKSYLPVKDAHLRVGIDKLLSILTNILSFGEISREIESSLVDKAHLKLASAKAVLRLLRHWEQKISIDLFYLTLRSLEVDFPEVRKMFLSKVYQYMKERLLDPKYAYTFLLNLDFQQSNIGEEKQHLCDILQMCQQGKARQVHMQTDATAVVYPEYILPYLVHALAHHSSCPSVGECKDFRAFEPIYRKLHLFLSMLMHGDEDGKSELTLRKDDAVLLISIFRSIKQSEDVLDEKKSKNAYAICDLGLSIIKHLSQQEDNLKEALASVSLPPLLYKPHEKKEEAGSQDTENQTWLADENVLAHFESLKLEAIGTVPSEIIEEDVFKDIETDGMEIPLGKIMKRLKAKGAKERKLAKNGSLPDGAKKENNIDILGMVREINLDNLDVSNKHESSNGHEHFTKESKTDETNARKRMLTELMNAPVPKRRRSLPSAQSLAKISAPRDSSKGSGVSLFDSIVKDDEEPVLDSQQVKSNFSFPSMESKGRKSDRGSSYAQEIEESEDHDVKKLKKVWGTDDSLATNSLKTESAKKRKRKSISGLAKCTSKGGENRTTDLIGCRIKVWWPMDKAFYKGLVKSYDHEKKKHVVLYTDGDIEVLSLEKEKWELVDSGGKPTKLLSLSKSPPPKGNSSGKKNKPSVVSNQKESIEISSSSKGKRTPRKNLKSGEKGISRTKSTAPLEVESKEDPEVSDPEPTTFSKVYDLNSDEDLSDREGRDLAGAEDADTKEKVVSKGKHVNDEETSSSATEQSKGKAEDSKYNHIEAVEGKTNGVSGSDEEETSYSKKKETPKASKKHSKEKGTPKVLKKRSRLMSCEVGNPDSEEKQRIDAESRRTEMGNTVGKSAASGDSVEAEISDDEPLSVWQSRVVKSVAGK